MYTNFTKSAQILQFYTETHARTRHKTHALASNKGRSMKRTLASFEALFLLALMFCDVIGSQTPTNQTNPTSQTGSSTATDIKDLVMEYIPTGREVSKYVVSTILPVLGFTLLKCACYTIPTQCRIKRKLTAFNTASFMNQIKNVVMESLESSGHPVRDLKDTRGTWDNHIIIATGAAEAASLAGTRPEILRRAKGFIFICGNFAPVHTIGDPGAFHISDTLLQTACAKLIEQEKRFSIIDILETINTSSARGTVGMPIFTLHTLNIPHVAHPNQRKEPKVLGADALSIPRIVNSMRSYITLETELFATNEADYPTKKLAKSYLNFFLTDRNPDATNTAPNILNIVIKDAALSTIAVIIENIDEKNPLHTTHKESKGIPGNSRRKA